MSPPREEHGNGDASSDAQVAHDGRGVSDAASRSQERAAARSGSPPLSFSPRAVVQSQDQGAQQQ